MSTGDQGFPKRMRLRRRPQFLAVGETGCKVTTAHFLLLWTPNRMPHPRLGVTVTRKVANAVGRNRLKRAVRESFRHSGRRLLPPVDVVVIARRHAPRLPADRLAAELEEAWMRIAELFRRNPP